MQRTTTRKMNVTGLRAVVMGGGKSGCAAALLLASRGAVVRLLERSPDNLDRDWASRAGEAGVDIRTGEHSAGDLANAALVVMSPGIPVRKVSHLFPGEAEVLSELELAWRMSDIPVLAVTGTNGKTTTVTLCKAILEEAGRKVFLGGNYGVPLAGFVRDGGEADVLVLEVSSFQLQTSPRFSPEVAVLTNLTPDHLDYHADMEEYLDAKWSMFVHQEEGDLAVLPEDLRQELTPRLPLRAAVRWVEPSGRIESPRLPGMHNQANMEAAVAACAHFGVDEPAALGTLRRFDPALHDLSHRLDCFLEKKGVFFVDDSKATTVDSLRAALASFDGPIRLLAGGKYKGGDLASLAGLIRSRVVEIGLFGGAEDVFRKAWEGLAPIVYRERLADALERLWRNAHPGDVILLSPATASFDQYANYKERGLDFQAAARRLS